MSANMSDSPSTPSAEAAASHSPARPLQTTSGESPSKKTWGAITAGLLLAITFWLYAKPDVVVMLAEQMWSCF